MDTIFIKSEVAFDKESAINLSVVSQGDTRTTRDGSKILATSIDVKMLIQTVNDPNQIGTNLRVLLIKAKQRFTPMSLATTADRQVLEDQGVIQCTISPYHRDNRSHFTVLYDKTFFINGSNGGNAGVNLHIRKKLNHIIEYQAASTTPERGNIWMILYGDLSNASNDGAEVSYISRLWYKDS